MILETILNFLDPTISYDNTVNVYTCEAGVTLATGPYPEPAESSLLHRSLCP